MSRRVFGDLLYRRVPHITGIYLAAGWGLLEFTGWATLRFSLSPLLSDLVMGLCLSMKSKSRRRSI